jgi:hypothetical protein
VQELISVGKGGSVVIGCENAWLIIQKKPNRIMGKVFKWFIGKKYCAKLMKIAGGTGFIEP